MCMILLRSVLSEISKPHHTLSNTQKLHALITRFHLSKDSFYATKIIRLYALNNDLTSARKLFDETPQRTSIVWNSIIRAYAKSYRFSDAFSLFNNMLSSETEPDNFTFSCIVRACADNMDDNALQIVYGKMVISGLGLDAVCCSALVSAYSKLGFVNEASKVFDEITEPDLVLWNTMITGYGTCGNWVKGFELLSTMRNKGEKPDGYTIVGLITCLSNHNLLEIGQVIHCFCIKNNFDSNDHVNCVLVAMYSRFKCIESASKLFHSLDQPDLVTWSALITAFSQSEDYIKALNSFRKMTTKGIKPDSVLLASVLSASSKTAIVGPGSEIHAYAIRNAYDTDIMVSSSLIDMYAKCGFLETSLRIFKNTRKTNIVTYNSVITSFGLYGLPSEARKAFDEALEKGLKPDESTFLGLLSACCHAGLVMDGRDYFRRMRGEFGIRPKTEHYVYMVKLLGMGGHLDEAYGLVCSLSEPVNTGIWGALLACCNIHGRYEMGEIVAKKLFEYQPEESRYKVMLSNLYACDGRWNEVENLRDNVFEKSIGTSWVNIWKLERVQDG